MKNLNMQSAGSEPSISKISKQGVRIEQLLAEIKGKIELDNSELSSPS